MATKSRTKTATRTARKRTVAAKPVMDRAVAKTREMAQSMSAKVRATSPKARKGIAAAAGLAVAAITAGVLVGRKKKKRSLW